MSALSQDDGESNLQPGGKACLINLVTLYFQTSGTDGRSCRPYDTALSTRRTCHAAIVFSGILAFSGLVGTVSLATALLKDSYPLTNINSAGVISTGLVSKANLFVVPLVLIIVVTFCNESLGLVHTTSLRWALWREGRLEFNTNLRLLTHARSLKSSHWLVNSYVIFVTAVSYTAAGQVFLANRFTIPDEPEYLSLSFSVPALAVMTFALCSQVAIATWSYNAQRHHVPTWSSNTLNNALACVHQGLEPRSNRTLVSYHKFGNKSSAGLQPQNPQKRQPSLAVSRPSAVLVVILLWAGVLVTLIWASCTFKLGQPTQDVGQITGASVLHQGKALAWTPNRTSSAHFRWTVVLIGMSFTFITQLSFTFALHCAELLVNATRDERLWRKASAHLDVRLHYAKMGDENGRADEIGSMMKCKKAVNGASIDLNAIKDAFTAWETILLFIFKLLIHWVFGETVRVSYNRDGSLSIVIWASCLFLLLASMFGVALFGTFLCFKRPRGPQPVAYGHMRTLNNLIDDWGIEHEQIYWGDKGHVGWDEDGEIRRAGTAGRSKGVGLIHTEARYR